MSVAVISFDQELSNKIKTKLSDYNIQLYIDSLSMLKEINSFQPDIIVYDASAGDFAVDDLKFLLTRDKLEDKNFKILVSKDNPINKKDLPENVLIDIFIKNEEDEKLIEDIKKTLQEIKGKQEVFSEEAYQPPDDLESLLGDFSSGTENIEESFETTSSSDLNPMIEEISSTGENGNNINEIDLDENIPESIEEVIPDNSIFEESVQIPKKKGKEVTSSSGNKNIKLEIEISPEELKRMIIELAVDKLVNDIKDDDTIKKLLVDLQKDFIDKTEKELEELKESLKKEIKENLVSKIESDLKDTIKESIREDVVKITSEIVKEKLEQLFGKK
ncbi:hypothetical protein [Persephonella sp.]